MGRTKRKNAEAQAFRDGTALDQTSTRVRLREAAIKVFAEKGFHDTKISDIVSAAGVSQPTFYNYFVSKDAAYEALVTEFREGFLQVTRRNLIPPEKPVGVVNQHLVVSFHRFLDYMASDPALTEIGFFQPPGCSITKAQVVDWIADNISQEQASQHFRSDIEPQHIARLMVGLLDQMGRLHCEPDERQKLAEVCSSLFCNGARG